jgi:tRNA-2-methylthio-N6-dimethylallyladenosine synthase
MGGILMSSMGSYYIETYGCQMNVRDSETLAGQLEELGFKRAWEAESADIVVLNTCSVREKPHHKVFSRLGELARLKQRKPGLIVAVCGCMAQIMGDRIAERFPCVDIILGPRNIARFQSLLKQVGASSGPIIVRDTGEVVPEALPVARSPGVGAFVNITYGCDNLCAYCVVPYARGRHFSREPQRILDEVLQAVAAGYCEVTLLGQNVNAYGHDLDCAVDFADLLAMVNDVPGLWRIRFTTSHPKDCSEKLLQAMAQLDKVCEHLHLALQAGDDEVLRRMGRGYTYDQYRRIVDRARELIPDLAITTDLMVGFPGETPAQFEKTLRAVEEIRFDQAFMFKYNDRPGTRAAEMPDKVGETEKQRRLEVLVELQNRIACEINEAQVGKTFEVLVEGTDRQNPSHVRGRTRQHKLVVFPAEACHTGNLLSVRAEAATLWGFIGTPVYSHAADQRSP